METGAAAPLIKTAVIGASGFVGRHLWHAYASRYPDCVGTSFASTANPRLVPFDIRRPDAAALRLPETGHRAVVIASAKPNVGFCENDRESSYAVNVKGTLGLIEQLGRLGLHVIFVSSDYVFDGKHGRYDDDAPTAPSTEYGRQKAEVERQIASLAAEFTVIRLSKVYGRSKGDGTLLDEMAAAFASGKEVRVAKDQYFSPTYVDDVVSALFAVQAAGMRGHLNLCSPERWSRAEIALALARAMGVDTALARQIALYDLPSMAGRPLDTSMLSSRLKKSTAATFVPLSESIAAVAGNWRRPA